MDTLYKSGLKNLFSYHYFKRSILLLYEVLIKPKSSNEDIQRKEIILNTVLLSLISICILLDLSLVYNFIVRGTYYTGISLLTFSGVLLTFIISYMLSRKSLLKISTYLTLTVCFIFVTYVEYYWGMSTPAGLLGYALIITMASILISGFFGIITTVIISFILISLAYYESNLGIVAPWKKEPTLFNTGIQYSFILLSITVLSWLSAREIKKSLNRARASEKALREKNESLEIIVEERTRALRQAQIEKMSQLYRFVEFGRLSSGIFHDLMNPLSIVTANVEVLQSNLHTNIPEIKDSVQRASIASKRMEQFISSVSKQVQTQNVLKTFSINNEIEEALLLFQYQARKHNIVINFYAHEEIFFTGNPIKFHQVISNLISNAIDSFEHPTSKSEKIILISLSQDSTNVEIKIKDNGCGIASELQNKIFESFFSTKHEHKGIGLGLSTTKHIIEKDFSGHIQVQSKLNEGTTFIISLPLANERQTSN